MINIRQTTPEDAGRLLQIYAYYVENTAITFEYEVPTEDEFRKRIEHITQKYPYIVLEEDGVIMGYTKCGEFHKCGYKFGRWYNMIWMEKMIGEHK